MSRILTPKETLITVERLWVHFFGIPKGARGYAVSDYLWRRPLSTGALSTATPRQLHETARHADGSYVHVEMGGVPALKPDVVDYLDGIPHAWVREAVDYLREIDPEGYRAFDAWLNRFPRDTNESVAGRLGCDESAFRKRRRRALVIIRDYLDRRLALKVGA